MERPIISIVVPVYNAAQYLTQCIESIIAQTYKDWELILVNDASTDESGKICEVYAKKYLNISVINADRGG